MADDPARDGGGTGASGLAAPPADARRGIRRNAAGIGVAVGAYGLSFGAITVAAGFSPLQAVALSTLAFTGGSQFAYVGVLGGGGAPVAGAAAAWLLGARNTLYAVRLAPLLRVRGGRRLLAAHGVIDESTAMATAQTEPALSRYAFAATFLSVFVLWNAATLLGAYGAGALGDPTKLGLDAAFPAAFLALLWPRLRADPMARRVAVGGALIALALTPVAPVGVPVLVSVLAVALGVPPLARSGRPW